MAEHIETYCEFRDCREVAECVQDDGLALCASHRKQFQRRGRLTEIQPALSREEAVLRAGSDWLEAEGDDDYDRARTRFLGMTERWMRSRGWRPPRQARGQVYRVVFVQLVLPLKVRKPRAVHARAYACGQAER